MFSVLIVFLVVMSSVWVYWDSTKHKIGKRVGIQSAFNMSAGAWAIATLGIWVVAFPAYLLKRSSLIELAKVNPVDVKYKNIKLIVLLVFGGLWVFFAVMAVVASPAHRFGEISGVWKARQDNAMIKIAVVEDRVFFSVNDNIMNVSAGDVDYDNDILSLNIVNGRNNEVVVWALHKLWDVEHNKFNLRIILNDGSGDDLDFVRKLTSDEIKVLSGKTETVAKAPVTEPISRSAAVVVEDEPHVEMPSVLFSEPTEIDSSEVKTKNGILSVSDNVLSFKDGLVATNVLEGSNALGFIQSWDFNDSDVVLVRDTGGTACPMQFYFVASTVSGIRHTRSFGTCSNVIKTGSDENYIYVAMPGFLGPFEPSQAREQAFSEKHFFKYEVKTGELYADEK